MDGYRSPPFIEADAVYLMNRTYVDFARLYRIHQSQAPRYREDGRLVDYMAILKWLSPLIAKVAGNYQGVIFIFVRVQN